MKKFFILTICCLGFILMNAQAIPKPLETKLTGKTRFTDIMREVNDFYLPDRSARQRILTGEAARNTPKPPRALKRWARWAQLMEGRLDEQGNVFDHQLRTYDEMQRYESQQQSSELIAGGNWTLLGPNGVYYGHRPGIGLGRVDRIAFHPTNPDIFYIGTPQGGLWRTTNGGVSWTCLTNSLPNLSVSGIVISKNNPNIIYILSGDGDSGGLVARFRYRRGGYGVVKSIDAGASWQIMPQVSGSPFGRGLDMKQDPNNENVLVVAAENGLFRSSDGGNTWAITRTGTFYNVAFEPSTSNILYATGIVSSVAVFMKSTNNGQGWTNFTTFDQPITDVTRMSLAVCPTVPGKVYLLCGKDDDDGGYGGFYRSFNYGSSFTRSSNSPNLFKNDDGEGSPQAGYDNTMCVRPDNDQIIITGGLVCFRSSNGGSSFGAISRYAVTSSLNDEYYVHPDIHQVAYNPLNNMLYACNDGGIWKSSDNGSNWGGIYNGLSISGIYHMDVYDGNNEYLGIGLQDNGIKLREGAGSTFSHAQEGDGFRLQYFHDDADKLYTVINDKVIKLLGGGTSENVLFDFYDFFPSLAIHETDNQKFYCGLNKFIGADNSGGTISYGTRNIPVSWCITTCPSNSNRIYAAGRLGLDEGDDGHMCRSDDGGDTWTVLTDMEDFPDMDVSTKITDIAVNPTNSNQVWITIGGFRNGVKVFYSGNAGQKWIDKSNSLPNVPVNCIAVDSDNNVYIGNDFGVFYRGNGWVDWKPFYNGLPRVPVSDIKISESLGRVRAATFGRSVFSSDLYGDCPPNLIVSSDQEGQRFHEASVITTTAKSQDGAGTQVFYRAADRVDMQTGFEVKNKSEMLAYTGPCSSGIPVFRMQSANQAELGGFRRARLPLANNKKFAYAYIRNWKWEGNQLKFVLDQVKEGNIRLLLADEEGRLLQTIIPGERKMQGSYELSALADGGMLAKKLCMLVMHDDILVHWQELN
jgi:photosystem II stability/assembly factor-like uncharacterized protein